MTVSPGAVFRMQVGTHSGALEFAAVRQETHWGFDVSRKGYRLSATRRALHRASAKNLGPEGKAQPSGDVEDVATAR